MDIYYRMDFQTARIDGSRGFTFSCGKNIDRCYSVVGTAVVSGGYPLYADAMNEKGLCMAGLEFPQLAYYEKKDGSVNNAVSPYEFIPWILTQCSTVSMAEAILKDTRLIDRPFSESLPLTPLHWMIADRERSIAVESVEEGLQVYPCDSNVLSNAPEYTFHAVNLRKYANLTAEQPSGDSVFGAPFSSGFGAIGLPGDFSSPSRFVKAAFVTKNAAEVIDESSDGVSEIYHALSSVSVPCGSVKTASGQYNMTVYTSCMDPQNGKYYRVPYSLSSRFERLACTVKA